MATTSATVLTFAASAFTALYQAVFFDRVVEPGPKYRAEDRACLVFVDGVSRPQQAWLFRAVLQSEHFELLLGALLLLVHVGFVTSVRLRCWAGAGKVTIIGI